MVFIESSFWELPLVGRANVYFIRIVLGAICQTFGL